MQVGEAPAQYPIPLRFQTWFFGLTLIYWVLSSAGISFFSGTFTDSGVGGRAGAPGTIIGNLIGMFVPIGPSNFMFFFLPTGLIAFGLVIASLVFVERHLSRVEHDRPIVKIFFNLLILFLLTIVTDLLTLGHWASLGVLLGKESWL